MSMCFFIGHRHTPQNIKERLDEAVERHILEYGVKEFLVGHYGDFDRMAAGAVRDAIQQYPEVRLFLLLPYYRPEKEKAPLGVWDGTIYPQGMETVPKHAAIVRANRYAVESCDYLISYVKGPGNSREILGYAQRKGLHIENLAEEGPAASGSQYSRQHEEFFLID